MGKSDFRKWLDDSWLHVAVIYMAVVVTLSLIVQVIATMLLGGW